MYADTSIDRSTLLDDAKKVLKPETIREVERLQFSPLERYVLDRWALNHPERVKELEETDLVGLLIRVVDQAHREEQVDYQVIQARARGMGEAEAFDMLGVDQRLH